MAKTIENLVGSKITAFEEIYDYWQIFTDTGIINIYNPFKILMPDGGPIQINEKTQEVLVDSIITGMVYEPDKYIMLDLNINKTLLISIAKKDYAGPEAIEINFKSGEFIVF